MNTTSSCHEVPDCNGIYIDAFYGNYLKTKSIHINNIFILTHYHSDHYRNLPRGSDNNISDTGGSINKNRNSNSNSTSTKGYIGPAQIHCTPITGSLLRSIHHVPSHLIVEHGYGETWTCHCLLSSISTKKSKSCSTSRKRPYNNIIITTDSINNVNTKTETTLRKITFYDANHCPGAAIVVIELPYNGIVHIHTGDMRYDPNCNMFRIPNQFQRHLSQHHEDGISTSTSINKVDNTNNPLVDAIQTQRVHTVLLDTTYAHPKHNFLSQIDAINTISSSIETILIDETIYNNNNIINNNPTSTGTTNIDTNTTIKKKKKTLILLSCYSIGKEKILWDVSYRTKQRIYVTEKKYKMLQCIQNNNNGSSSSSSNDDVDNNNNCTDSTKIQQQQQQQQKDHYNIIDHCTTDPTASNIHVVPMGLAGQLWPYYQPNYWACVEYANTITNNGITTTGTGPTTTSTQEGATVQPNVHSQIVDDDDVTTTIQQQQQNQEEYTNIVAFIPTGWADGSNWNKKHSITSYNCNDVIVEIRLISYSEHSTYNELQQFIQYVQPHTIIPTVYKDSNDRRSIIARFASYINSNRVKQSFIQSMTTTTGTKTKSCPTKFQSSTSCKGTSSEGLSNEIIQNSSDKTDTESSLCIIDSSKHSNDNDNRMDTNINTMEVQNNNSYSNEMKSDNANMIIIDINTDDDDEHFAGEEYNDTNEKKIDNDNDDGSIIEVISSTASQSPSTTDDVHIYIQTEAAAAATALVTMGFRESDATNALQECSGNIDQAIEFLLSSQSINSNNNNKNDVVSTNCTITSMRMNDTSVNSRTTTSVFSSGSKVKQKSRLSLLNEVCTSSPSSTVSPSSSSTKNHSIKKFFRTKMK